MSIRKHLQLDGSMVKNVGEVRHTVDASAGGVINVDLKNGPVQRVSTAALDTTLNMQNFPDGGGSVTLLLQLTGAAPDPFGITPIPENGNPDLANVPADGEAVLEVWSDDGVKFRAFLTDDGAA